MKINKQFAPFTITIETKEDLQDLLQICNAAKGYATEFGWFNKQPELLQKIILFERDFLK